MFGKINDEQNIKTNDSNCGKLLNNPKFVAVSVKMSEEKLFILIQKMYDNKDKEELLKYCDIYRKYDYKNNLDTINKYTNYYK